MELFGWRARALTVALVAATSVLGTTLPASASDASDLAAQITAYTSTLDSDYTVSVLELGDGGVAAGVAATKRVEPASVIKLFYAWATLRRVDMGSLRLTQKMSNGLTWDRCLQLMISISDNKCSADIRVALGNRTLNSLFAASGYPDTYIKLTTSGAYDGKRTSAADTTRLLARLEQGDLLSPASTDYFHQLLKDQAWRTRINLGVPAGVRVENKSGELWVTSGWTQSDAAIIRGPQSTYVLTVFGRNEAEKTAVAEISRIVYEFLQGEEVVEPAKFSSYQYIAATTTAVRATRGGRVLYTVAPNTRLKAYWSERNWVEVKQAGKARGWVTWPSLRLRAAYRWE